MIPMSHALTTAQLESRLTVLEHEVARLKTQIATAPTCKNNWIEAIAGTFANDPVFDDAMRLGRKWRQSQRPKLRRAKSPASVS